MTALQETNKDILCLGRDTTDNPVFYVLDFAALLIVSAWQIIQNKFVVDNTPLYVQQKEI